MISKILMVALFFTFSSQLATAAVLSNGADQKLEWEVIRKFNMTDKTIDIAHSLDGKYAFVLTEQHVVTVYDQGGVLQGSIPVDQGVNAIAIDPMGQYLHLSDNSNNTYYTLALDFIKKFNSANAPTKGDMKAPVTVAVFSDFQ